MRALYVDDDVAVETLNARVIVRSAVPADADALGRLGAMLVRQHHAFDADRFMAAPPRLEELYGAFLVEQMTAPNVLVLSAECEGSVVGYAYAGVEGVNCMALRESSGVLYDIVVDPAYRGQGIGRRLLRETLGELSALGAPRAILMTAEHNAAAQHLFEREGFRRTMIEMTRELPSDDC